MKPTRQNNDNHSSERLSALLPRLKVQTELLIIKSLHGNYEQLPASLSSAAVFAFIKRLEANFF
jgi:hypothetical protein